MAVGIAQLLRLQYPLYALVGAVIVTDLSPSETRRLGLQRLAGTLLGATAGALVSEILPPYAWVVGLSILAAMFLSHLLHLEGAAKITGYVCGIVVLNHGDHPWSYALYRLVETLVGVGMGLLVSVVPKLIPVEKFKQRDSAAPRS